MGNAEIMRENLGDMLGVEQHIYQSIQRQIGDERARKFFNARELLQKTQSVLSLHIAELEHRLATVDGGPESKLKKAATIITGSAAGLYGKLRTGQPVSKNLRDDCISLNLAALSYGMLSTAALALNENEIAAMAQRHLTELTPLIVELSELIPFVLANELAHEGKIEDTTVAQQAAALYRQAWSHEVTTRI